jgi:hypothetical protein
MRSGTRAAFRTILIARHGPELCVRRSRSECRIELQAGEREGRKPLCGKRNPRMSPRGRRCAADPGAGTGSRGDAEHAERVNALPAEGAFHPLCPLCLCGESFSPQRRTQPTRQPHVHQRSNQRRRPCRPTAPPRSAPSSRLRGARGCGSGTSSSPADPRASRRCAPSCAAAGSRRLPSCGTPAPCR